jgi:hypothetical protein
MLCASLAKWTLPETGYGFAALRAWNEQRALVPQTHSPDGAEFGSCEDLSLRALALEALVLKRTSIDSKVFHKPSVILNISWFKTQLIDNNGNKRIPDTLR